MEKTFTEPTKNDSDLSGMNPSNAKEYIVGFISTKKLIEKQLDDLENDIKKWETRVALAKNNNMQELAIEAEKEVEQKNGKKQQLTQELNELKDKINDMMKQLPLLAAKERSIDPDLLEQELLMATGYLPGEEKQAETDRMFNEIEKEANVDAALSELKAKIGKQN
jgi:phage shock protein A